MMSVIIIKCVLIYLTGYIASFYLSVKADMWFEEADDWRNIHNIEGNAIFSLASWFSVTLILALWPAAYFKRQRPFKDASWSWLHNILDKVF